MSLLKQNDTKPPLLIMEISNCLNCDQTITGRYCANCGQKKSTHRYSIVHFFEHDLVHGIWHVDRGVFFTIKELFTRPGHSVREFILGKRVDHFSFVTLILLILAASALLSHYSSIRISDLMPEASKAAMNTIEKFMSEHPKLILLLTIPINALFSLLWFRKAKFNYSEHLVLNSYKTAAELLVGLLFTAVTIFYTNTIFLIFFYYVVITGFTFVYSIIYYAQFFAKSGYSKKGLWLRSILAPCSFFILSLVLGIIWGMLTKK